MRRNGLRQLNEGQVRHVLAAGGMLVETAGQWRAHRNRDARMKPAGWTTQLIASRLQSERAVIADPERPVRLIAASTALLPQQPVMAPPAALLQTGIHRRSDALLAELTRDPAFNAFEMTRLKAAARRFQADINQAAARQSAGPAPDAAVSRLAVLEKGVGLQTFRRLEALIVDAVSLSGFARHSACREADAPDIALAVLRSLANAYDLTLKPAR